MMEHEEQQLQERKELVMATARVEESKLSFVDDEIDMAITLEQGKLFAYYTMHP